MRTGGNGRDTDLKYECEAGDYLMYIEIDYAKEPYKFVFNSYGPSPLCIQDVTS